MDIRMRTCTSFEFRFLVSIENPCRRPKRTDDVLRGSIGFVDAKYSQCDRFDERADRNNIIERIGFEHPAQTLEKEGERQSIDPRKTNGGSNTTILYDAAAFVGFESTDACRHNDHIACLSSYHRTARIHHVDETPTRYGIFLFFAPDGSDELRVSSTTETKVLKRRNK